MRCAVGWLLLALGGTAAAQDPFDPNFDPQQGEAGGWHTFGDVLLRGDRVSGLPGGRADLERGRLRIRAGLGWLSGDGREFAVAARAAAATAGNGETRANLDNERSRGAWLDQLVMRWRLAGDMEIAIGKAPLPLSTSPLWWDADLRPAGIGLTKRYALAETHELRLAAGYWRNQHLYGDRSRLAALQVGWSSMALESVRTELVAGLLRFLDTDALVAQGLARGNRVADGGHLSSFRMVHVEAAATWSLANRPLELRALWLRNLGAFDDGEDSGARVSLILGDRRVPQSWEFGVAWQRMQRDAVLAAFSDDDWWFHTAARGVMPWVGYGFDDRWSLRLAAFQERRDDLTGSTRRVLLDLAAEW